jgi:exopolysaccharide production protein ExoY
VLTLDHLLAITRASAEPQPFGGPAKRALDIVISACALVFFAPILLAIAVAVKVEDGGPILFVQPRVGLRGFDFRFLKFRSMAPNASALLQRLCDSDPVLAEEWRVKQKLSRDPRVTRIGRILRRSSLDELPQFLNVFIGEMSIVGPRPMMRDQIEVYGGAFERYCIARPGITGLWQVSGRNETTFHRRSALDEIYLRRWSPGRDLMLILRTFGAVFAQRGAC